MTDEHRKEIEKMVDYTEQMDERIDVCMGALIEMKIYARMIRTRLAKVLGREIGTVTRTQSATIQH